MPCSASLTGWPSVCTTQLATVVVDVHHPGLPCDGLGDLVEVPGRLDAGANVEGLPGARLAHRATHRPVEKPVGPVAIRRAVPSCLPQLFSRRFSQSIK